MRSHELGRGAGRASANSPAGSHRADPADEAYAREALPQTPSRWYLTGFLVPYEADARDREDETSNEQLDLGVAGSGDDEATPDPASARKAFLPSSLGVSLLVSPGTRVLHVVVTWGDYRYVPPEDKGSGSEGAARWERTQRRAELDARVDKPTAKPVSTEVPESDGLKLVVSTRAVAHDPAGDAVQNLPQGTRAVSVFLVNHRTPKLDVVKDEALVFQAGLETFLDAFRQEQWPGRRLPELYFDPRSLASGPGPRASLHAKGIVVDDTRALVTSANFTEAAHDRNIEAGVLVDSVSFATSMRQQFESLVECGLLRKLPV